MELVQIESIPRLLNVLKRMVNVPRLFDEVIINGEINDHGLRNLERILSQIQRYDLIHVFQQTMQGT